MTCYNLNWPKICALSCLFLCFKSYSEKLEVYILTSYKIWYILEELYVTVYVNYKLAYKLYIDQLKVTKVI